MNRFIVTLTLTTRTGWTTSMTLASQQVVSSRLSLQSIDAQQDLVL